MDTYNRRGGAEALVQVVRGMPGLLLKPVRGLLVGGALPLRAMAAAADPTIRERAQRKYKNATPAAGADEDADDDFVVIDSGKK